MGADESLPLSSSSEILNSRSSVYLFLFTWRLERRFCGTERESGSGRQSGEAELSSWTTRFQRDQAKRPAAWDSKASSSQFVTEHTWNTTHNSNAVQTEVLQIPAPP